MGAITGLLGLGGGASGSGFAAPTSATLTNGTNPGQLNSAYSGNQNALQSQQALLQALQSQNGVGNQNQVYNQLQGVASGAVNPAQNQLNQNTATNVANQAALMAGQRGASANVGLLARQAAQQGAAVQQQAVGQAATNQSTNQLNAIGAAGNLANNQVTNQIGATGANTSAQQTEQGQLLNANAQQNANNTAMQSNVNSTNAGLAGKTMEGQQGVVGGVLNAAGPALAALAGGGMVPGPQSAFGKSLVGQTFAFGGNVGCAMKTGGAVPGKPKVGGAVDSYANDTVDAKLSPGEVVIPRHVMMGKNPVADSAKFVAAILAKKRVR